MITSPAFRYHGGKFRIAEWVMSHFPPHRCYVEPFGGAAGVLIQKPRAYAEVYNDLDGELCNFFRVIRDQETRRKLQEACVLTPYAREEFELAYEPTDDPVELARRLVVRAQMGFGSAGATKSTTGFRIDTKREYGTAQQLWAQYPDTLGPLGERLSGVLIENRPGIEVMRQHDAPETLHFVDPPYLHETRVRPRSGGYRHEMSDDDHRDLLDCLLNLRGMVVLSGYDSEIYNEPLTGWAKRTTEARSSSFRGTKMSTEVVWLNPTCVAALERREGLFAV